MLRARARARNVTRAYLVSFISALASFLIAIHRKQGLPHADSYPAAGVRPFAKSRSPRFAASRELERARIALADERLSPRPLPVPANVLTLPSRIRTDPLADKIYTKKRKVRGKKEPTSLLNGLTRADVCEWRHNQAAAANGRLRSPENVRALPGLSRPGAPLSTILLIYEYYPLLRVALAVGARVIKRDGRVCVIADVRREEDGGREKKKW